MNTLVILFIVSWFLFGIGAYGLMTARSLLRVLIALQLMVKGALLILVVAGYFAHEPMIGQNIAITVITVDTLVMVIGLALAVQVKSHIGTLDVDEVIHLEG